MRKIIAIDFDGCLVESQWPDIGKPRWEVVRRALLEKEKGAALILWTCRTGEHLDRAVDFCHRLGLDFDAVNDNLPEMVEAYGGSNCRKVVADEYWDDHAVLTPAPEVMDLKDVVELLYAMVGDECACNVNGNDEWLPYACPHCEDGTCPDPEGRLECWLQFIKNFQRKEATLE